MLSRQTLPRDSRPPEANPPSKRVCAPRTQACSLGLGEQVQLLGLEGELRCGALPAGACLLLLASRPASSTSGPTLLKLQRRPVRVHTPAFLPPCLGGEILHRSDGVGRVRETFSHRLQIRGLYEGMGQDCHGIPPEGQLLATRGFCLQLHV